MDGPRVGQLLIGFLCRIEGVRVTCDAACGRGEKRGEEKRHEEKRKKRKERERNEQMILPVACESAWFGGSRHSGNHCNIVCDVCVDAGTAGPHRANRGASGPMQFFAQLGAAKLLELHFGTFDPPARPPIRPAPRPPAGAAGPCW